MTEAATAALTFEALLQALLIPLLELVAPGLAAALAVFARVGTAAAVMPAFGERLVPMRLRLAGALALTAIITPAVMADLGPLPESPLAWARFIGGEALAGLALGLALRLMVMALQIAGTVAAQTTSLAQALGGAGPDPQPAIAQVLTSAGLCVLVLTGFPERAVEFLLLSYQLLPAGGRPDPAALATWGVSRVARAFALGFTLAAPFVIGAALYNLALGAINRAMPMLMVAFVGAPAIALGGLIMLALSAPMIIVVWLRSMLSLLASPVGP